ncbi:MAG: MFS transporter [Rhodopseudomonas palustris]|uniref:MFS transporter n=1 Tax=Rhodopseudomonas palustris TaxID=1076 RepID=A0A933RW73_RHOPL|nr:MFS transporter [Rhodopseudomonas palustris]
MGQTGGSDAPARLPPALNIIALSGFAASLSTRALDPVLPRIATEFSVSIATAAGLAAITAFTFAAVQPAIGALADMFGKARLMIVCLALLGLASLLGAMTTSFELLFLCRILAGIGSGGVFPVALGLTGDLVEPQRRQVAIGRVLGGSMTGNLLGASASGVIGDVFGWRGVLTVLGLLVIVAALAVAFGFRNQPLRPGAPMDLAALRRGYRTIFSNPNALICFAAVLVEGTCVMGAFPYVAAFLHELGQESLAIAGLVIAGFAVGGLLYTLTVARLLPRLGVNGMMIGGGALVGLQLAIIAFGPPWQAQAACFIAMGMGFYMLHGCIQVFASELTETARGTAMSLHSFFFFIGQTTGPIAYGFGLAHAGKVPTLLVAGVTMLALGLVLAAVLRPRPPADAAVVEASRPA